MRQPQIDIPQHASETGAGLLREQVNDSPLHPNWQYTTKDGTLRAYEGGTAFWLVDVATGNEACMGDMVDRFNDDVLGMIWVGTDEFYRALESDLESAASEYREAYFSA